jgi:hypothetical protein
LIFYLHKISGILPPFLSIFPARETEFRVVYLEKQLPRWAHCRVSFFPRGCHAGQSGHAARHLASPCAGRGHKARQADRERLASTSFDTTRLASVHRSPAAAAAPSPLQVPLAAALRPLSPRPTTNLAVLRQSRRYPRPHPRRWDRCRRLSGSRLQYIRPPGLASSPESGSLTKPLPLRRRDRSPQPLAASQPSRLVRLPPRQPSSLFFPFDLISVSISDILQSFSSSSKIHINSNIRPKFIKPILLDS